MFSFSSHTFCRVNVRNRKREDLPEQNSISLFLTWNVRIFYTCDEYRLETRPFMRNSKAPFFWMGKIKVFFLSPLSSAQVFQNWSKIEFAASKTVFYGHIYFLYSYNTKDYQDSSLLLNEKCRGNFNSTTNAIKHIPLSHKDWSINIELFVCGCVKQKS